MEETTFVIKVLKYNAENDVEKCLEKLSFKFAKTMPKNQHYYTVKSEKFQFEYEVLYWHIKIKGYDKQFYDKIYRYCNIGNFTYWIMSDDIKTSKIINRTHINYGEHLTE